MKKQVFILACGICAAPVYADLTPGTVAVYSDGRAEKLISVDAQTMLWEDDRKRRYLRSRMPYLPDLEYTRFPAAAGGYVQAPQSDRSLELVPFGTQTYTEFLITRSTAGRTDSVLNWRCEYVGQSERKVLGDMHAVHDYSCIRYVFHRKLMAEQFRQQEKITFAPALGLIVKRKSITRTRERSEKLIALLAPDQATDKAIGRMLKSLRKKRG